MKKFVATVLSCALMLSSVAFVYAEDAKSSFFAAVEATNKEIKREQELSAEIQESTQKIMERLVEDAYEISVSASIVSMDSEYGGEEAVGTGVEYSLKQSAKTNSVLFSMDLSMPTEIMATKMTIMLYVDDEKIGYSMPSLSKNFYYINRSEIDDYADALGWSDDVTALLDMMTSMTSSNVQLNIDASVYKEMLKQYTKVIMATLNEAEYKFGAERSLSGVDGAIKVKDISLTLSPELLNKLFASIADTMRADEVLRELITVMQASADYGETDLLTTLCDTISATTFTESLTYTAGIADSGIILSHQLTTGNVGITIDTVGADCILDKILFEASQTSDGVISGVNVVINNTTAPADGIFIFKAESFLYAKAVGSTETILNSGIINMDYTWDTNKKENNFIFNMSSGEILKASGYPFSIKMSGGLWTDEENNTVIYENGKMEMTLIDISIEMDMSMKFAPIDPAMIKMTNPVNISELSDEQLEILSNIGL